MNYSLIKNGVVENIIIAEEDFIVKYAAEQGYDYVDFEKYPNALIGATTTDNVNFDTSCYKKAPDNFESQTIEPTTIGMQSI